jgi:WD40 repeat protein
MVYATEDRLQRARNQYFHVWNVPRARELSSFFGSDSEVLSLVALDNQRVLSSHEDEKFRIWDVESGAQLRRVDHRCGKAGPLIPFDKDSLLFAPVNPNAAQKLHYWHWPPSDRTLRLWDMAAGAEVALLQCATAINDLIRFDRSRLWARDEAGSLHLIEVLRPPPGMEKAQ